jgi:hypothetical protein
MPDCSETGDLTGRKSMSGSAKNILALGVDLVKL